MLGDAGLPSVLLRREPRSLGNAFPFLPWEEELRDLMALVLLEHLTGTVAAPLWSRGSVPFL